MVSHTEVFPGEYIWHTLLNLAWPSCLKQTCRKKSTVGTASQNFICCKDLASRCKLPVSPTWREMLGPYYSKPWQCHARGAISFAQKLGSSQELRLQLLILQLGELILKKAKLFQGSRQVSISIKSKSWYQVLVAGPILKEVFL